MGRHTCSQCQSEQVTALKLNGGQARALGLPSFTILGYEKCLSCGAVSERFAPVWAWFAAVAVTGALTLLLVGALVFGGTLFIGWLPYAIVVGLFASVAGLARALRKRRVQPRSETSDVPNVGPAAQPRAESIVAAPPTPDAVPYWCYFGGWYPTNGTREQLTGAGRVHLSKDTIRIESQDGGSTFAVDTPSARALCHPVTSSFCIAVGERRWVSFRVSGKPAPGQPLIEARLQELLGRRFRIWTRPETKPGVLGCAGVLVFGIMLLAGGFAYAIWTDSMAEPLTFAVRIGLGSAVVGLAILFGFLGVKVVRRALRAAARAREI